MGSNAAGALNGLVRALDDPSAYVRALAADALGNIGPTAKPAVKPLSVHLRAANEQVFVLRSVAAALGDIGPDAAAALPDLEQAVKMPRVAYTAEEAIHRIKGEPIHTW
jgi:HEAT repeat protein